MESSPSSKLKFFDETGTQIPSPVEGRECGIAVDVPPELLSEISLRIGSLPLQVFFDKKANWVYAEWPVCGPGYYELSLDCRGYVERLQIVLVPKFFNGDDFNTIISDLTETLPVAIVSQLAKCGAQLGTLDHKPTVENEYHELRRALVGTKERLGLLQILPTIQRECHHILVPRTEVRNTNAVRRPDISRLSEVMSMPGNVLTPTKVYQMFDITVERSFDTHENRLVKTYVQALRSRLSMLQGKINQAPPAVASELATLVSDFNLACARATFLREVKLPTIVANRVTMVLLKNPSYRAIFEDYLALNQQASVSLQEAALNNSLNEFPFLYELWANLRVMKALLQVCGEKGFQCVSHNWVKRFNKRIFVQVMNDQKSAIELSCPKTGRYVSLVPWRPQGGSESLADTSNRERLMALAIVIDTPGKPSQVLLFDPEYRVAPKSPEEAEPETVTKKGKKTNRKKTLKTITARATTSKTKTVKPEVVEMLSAIEPMKEDVEELVRCIERVRAPDGSQRIQYAAILYPGQKMEFTSDVEALSAHPSTGDEFHKDICEVLRRYLT